MARKAVTIPTSLIWAFLMLTGVILLILMTNSARAVGNAVLSVLEEVAKIIK